MVVSLNRWALLGLAAYKYHLVGAVAYGCVVAVSTSCQSGVHGLLGFGGAQPDM